MLVKSHLTRRGSIHLIWMSLITLLSCNYRSLEGTFVSNDCSSMALVTYQNGMKVTNQCLPNHQKTIYADRFKVIAMDTRTMNDSAIEIVITQYSLKQNGEIQSSVHEESIFKSCLSYEFLQTKYYHQLNVFDLLIKYVDYNGSVNYAVHRMDLVNKHLIELYSFQRTAMLDTLSNSGVHYGKVIDVFYHGVRIINQNKFIDYDYSFLIESEVKKSKDELKRKLIISEKLDSLNKLESISLFKYSNKFDFIWYVKYEGNFVKSPVEYIYELESNRVFKSNFVRKKIGKFEFDWF